MGIKPGWVQVNIHCTPRRETEFAGLRFQPLMDRVREKERVFEVRPAGQLHRFGSDSMNNINDPYGDAQKRGAQSIGTLEKKQEESQ